MICVEYKKLAKNVKVPVLGLGTAGIGRKLIINIFRDKKAAEALKTGIEFGMTHIDTAEMYGNGHSEELIGEVIQSFDRKKLFITTKVKGKNLRFDDVIKSAKASLNRLKLDYIDLYLVHWPNPSIPLRETMKAMEKLVRDGIIRFIGVSNFDVKLMKEAQSHLKDEKIVTNQVRYNLLHKEPEGGVLEYCQRNNILLTAYSPLAKGQLAKFDFELLGELSEKYGKTQAQIAINWLISKDNVITIPQAFNIAHLKENLGAVGWRLDEGDMEKLDEGF